MHLRYDTTAAKRTVSVTLNSDLYAKAKEAGLNVSQLTEQALSRELEERLREQARAEIRAEMDAYNAFVEKHGSFAEMAREQFGLWNDDDAV
ncbi:type II toxin-antitoxin system CcdA family antitoxin [Azospirillum sp.]|uniref:type II toxin-antitoxin system CcdA family antitoxin n=1 Tax=Azospirillum sp. TaxID=34012 RepID=UPI002D5E4BFD|nr:type II toxin-antitoxin system CcdA family antitoxin [Azospirillum sp.]HYD65798.1 type II toxin-antitoxin system CcdA family antitoxin [Azospirillum sp.]